MVEGIKRGQVIEREDWYEISKSVLGLGRGTLISKTINRITLSGGDLLWRVICPIDWLLAEHDATDTTA